MSEFQLKNSTYHTSGEVYALGQQAPDFVLTATDFSEVSLDDYKGKALILNIFPSIDTSICFSSCDKFNALANEEIPVLCISKDLPFALKRVEEQNRFKNVRFLSDYRDNFFGELYGLTIIDGPLRGLLAREVIVLDSEHFIMYQDYVTNISDLPQCELAIDIMNELKEGVRNE